MTTAVVAGSATGVLAAPYSAPTAEVANSWSLAPVLVGEATAPGSGTQSLRFSARTKGATGWDLLDGVSVSGTRGYLPLPAGRLGIGQAFEYQVAHCDTTGCTSSAVQTGQVSAALAAGERPGGTRLPFTVGDRLGAQVDAGSGNLLVTSALFSLPRRSGAPLEVGLAYNSRTRNVGAQFPGSVGDAASGWRLSTGADVRLRFPGDGSVVYHGPNGLTGTFTPESSGFAAPAGFKSTLAAASGGGWTLTDHGSGEVRQFTTEGQLTKLTDRNGNASTFGYDADGSLNQIRADQGSAGASTLTVATEGEGRGRITTITQTAGGASRSVNLSYDPATGYLSSLTDQEGRTTEFTHGANGNLNRITAPGDAQTSFTYDDHGRVQTVTQPTGQAGVQAVTRFSYPDGQTLVADPNSDQDQPVGTAAHTTYQLTDDGWLLVERATDPAGHERSVTYTPQFDVATATDPAGTSSFGYDPAVNGGESLTSTRSTTGAGTAFAYANTAAATRYQPTSGTDAQGRTSTYTYNGAGNRLSAIDAGSAQAAVTYNADGTVATSTSPSGAVTSYGYDSVGQLTSITPPAGTTLGQRTYSYDNYGRVATSTTGRGVTETYTYDDLDRVLEVDYSDTTPTVAYAYDDAGTIDTRSDASGTTDYGYDPLGRLTSRSHTANASGPVSYSYDKAGNLATATNAAGTTRYSYDSRNLVIRAVTPSGRAIEFTHDPSGRRTDTVFHPTAGFSYDGYSTPTSFAAHTHTDYDAAGRITQTWTAQAGNDTDRVTDLSYTYASPGPAACPNAPATGTDTGLRWTQTDHRTGKVTSYCYDRANRLISATTSGADSWTYTYDGNGNRTQTTKNGAVVQSLDVNPGDQITGNGYSFDASGNTTAAPSVGSSVGYNGAEQMTTRTAASDGYSSGGSATYTYAGTDQTELIAQSGGFDYTYGRTNTAGLPILESYTSSGVTYSYTYDPQGTPLALEGANSHYLALDGLGSPVALVNHSGTQTAAYAYTPYGQSTATPLGGSGVTNVQIYGYAGGLTDRRSSLVHFGQRWYDPASGRWTQEDSLETLADPSRANRYEYADGNPTNYVDPTGQISLGCALAIAAFAAENLIPLGKLYRLAQIQGGIRKFLRALGNNEIDATDFAEAGFDLIKTLTGIQNLQANC
ncbi:RHS repeat-associated core domain-containing protein [Geodermatophilus aquaeductus]|uniref:RHS repeat-associated core domain-containing protein n=1 Tax=Geodermatophilus aquaeductus TaxID=1564161 RepID=A0A521EN71_9ACTN|nr:RHS repeat-associated core domain-containing protein [Geodermatophilus aquaeductus]SMO84560.1 RHS repeat-associated core domain-containing protein [Geodermatophilus aquaeductus]